MKVTVAEPRFLTDSISVISELVNDVQLKVDKEKMEIVAMDPASVAMVIFKILNSAFSEYTVESPVTLGISLDSLKTVLKRAKPDDIVSLELDDEKSRLKIRIKGKSSRTFSLSLIDLEEKVQKVPELKFPLKIETTSTVFEEAIADMDVVSESVAFGAEKEAFIVESSSTLNDARVEVKTDSETHVKMDGSEGVRSKYSLEYLKKIVKGGKLCPTVTLQFAKDYPLHVQYLLKDRLSLTFVLAPRVSND